MMRANILISYIIILFVGADVFSQNYYTIENGLSDNNVTTIHKDSFGFLWVGTQNGLNRFDGYDIKTYQEDPDDSTSLSYHEITDIEEDKNGNLWIATFEGLNFYNREKEEFSLIGGPDSPNPIPNPGIFQIKCQGEKLIIGHWLGISVLDMVSFEIKNYRINTIDDWKQSGKCFTVDSNYIWYATNAYGIYKIDFRKESSNLDEAIQHIDNSKVRISSICNFKDEVIVGKADGNLLFLNKDSDKITYCKTPLNLWIQKLFIKDSTLYFASWYNLFSMPLYTDKRETSQIKKMGMSFPEYINDIWINDEIIWCGVKGNGFTSVNTSFGNAKTISLNKLGIPNGEVILISNDQLNNTWVFSNTKAGIVQDETLIEKVKIAGNKNIDFPKSDTYLSLVDFFQSENMDYWIVFTKKIKRINYQTGEVTSYEFISGTDEKTTHNISIAFSWKNQVYVKANRLYEFDTFSNQFKSINVYKDPFLRNLDTTLLHDCYFDKSNNRVWYRFYYNLYVDDYKNNTHKIFSEQHVSGINTFDMIYQMTCDNFGNLWMAARNGLFYLNPEDTTSSFYSSINGMSHSSVISVNTDSINRVWACTPGGLNILDVKSKEIHKLFKGNGIGTNHFKTGQFFTNKDGDFVLGGYDRILIFNPNVVEFKNKMDVPFVFTKIQIGKGEGRFIKQPYLVQNIRIPYKENSVSFEFALLTLLDAEKCKYRYRMNDDNWISIEHKHSISLSNIPPGKYKLEIEATSPTGVKVEEPLTIVVTIIAPWYKTIVFRFAILLFFLLSGFSIYHIRVHRIRVFNKKLRNEVKIRTQQIEAQKEELKQQADNMLEINKLLTEQSEELKTTTEELIVSNKTKDKFFSIIAHDLRNPFMGIMGFANLLESRFYELDENKKIKFITNIKESSQTAYQLLENLLQWSMSQTNEMNFNPEGIKIHEIVSRSIELLILNAENKKLIVENRTDANHLVFADQNMITTVVRNLISNAIKFTPIGGKIEVFSIRKENSMIEIHIQDNGMGIKPEVINTLFLVDKVRTTEGTIGEKGTGLGLSLCKDFVEMNKGTIRVQSELNEGSDFIIELPEYKKANNELTQEADAHKKVDKDSIFDSSKILNPDNNLVVTIDEQLFKDQIILIIEDNEKIRSNLKSSLEETYKIIEATNGKEGWECAIAEIPNFIISDVMMPEMDGFELSNKLKNDLRTSHIPVILLTARNSDESQIKGLETGADDYLTKPVNLDVLNTRIKNILFNRKNLQIRLAEDIIIKPGEVTPSATDEQFLKKAIKHIENNIENPEFTAEVFIKEMGMGHTMLYRKMNQLTGQPVSDFIRSVRLKKAALLLTNSAYNISDVAFKVGFTNLNSFSRAFNRQFGKSPSEWMKKK